MDFSIQIANKTILIHSVYNSVYHLCKDYLVDEQTKPDIEIVTNDDLIAAESEQLITATEYSYTLKTAERFLIHRLITEALLDYNTFLMHGAVVAVNNQSYLFSGKSGTGKTTHVKKWINSIDGSYIVNGDKPFIIVNESGAFACGTPWCGKELYGKNTIIPLRSIVFMERNDENHIEEVALRTVFPLLLQQTYQPADAEKMKKTLALLAKLKEYVSFYRFQFNNLKEDCVQVSYTELTKNEPC